MWVILLIADNSFIRFLSSRGVGLIERSSDFDKFSWSYEFILIMELLSSRLTTYVGSRSPNVMSIKPLRFSINRRVLQVISTHTSISSSLYLF